MRRRPPLALPLVLAAALFTVGADAPSAASGGAPPLLGFGLEAAAAQRDLEARFDAALRAEDLREWMRRLTAHPHPVGSPWGKENADFMAGLFRSWGYDTALEEFQVLFPTPKLRRLEMLAPTPFTAFLTEPPLPEDATSGQAAEQLPTYNAYSIDGDVTGELVYVNYGVPKDYEELERRGVGVRGKIVIARYGGSWRGIKPKVAAEKGAVGCIIYSDPSGDGYWQGDVYPKGGWRSEHSVQRGSVADMPLHSGDALTPFVGATKNAKRLKISEARTLTKIPVLPISYGDALPLLRAMGGPMAPEGWRGALPIPYHLGPGPARVRLQVAFNWDLATAYDVVAKLRGSELPDQWIVRGNHHDGWANGAADPISGMIAVLAEAKAVGELAKAGFRPRRTLVYAGWDAEEPGLLGSVEWAETHAEELQKKAVAYINTDGNMRGFFGMGGSQTLQTLMNQVARDVTDPQKSVSVAERARAWLALAGSPEEKKAAAAGKPLPIYPLGSGSDYTPFLQHLGIASLDIGFGGEDQYGQYHSIYDSFDHYVRFGDPGFAYGVALAKVGGRTVLRLSQAEVLPFDFAPMAEAVSTYVKEVGKLADDLREETAERNRRIENRTFELFDDPTQTWVVPKALPPVPHLNLAPLQNAAAALETAAGRWTKAREAQAASGKPLTPEQRTALDRILMASERALTREKGLPGRPWYRHQVYAPGQYTGYGVKTLPAVREAIELRRWPEAEEQAAVVAKVLEGFAREVDKARAILEQK
ncbi:MAG TPA: transferrin receptor-like dimerization domain-containing protein [Thermoanaerobaculia bacterium]|nr:transferrin receptor-like dimerization domain-containing protein [Thermoanaerobaculia bacterium]